MKENRFEIFKEVCAYMDKEEYYEAYLKLKELSDYCFKISMKQANEEMNQLLSPIGLRV